MYYCISIGFLPHCLSVTPNEEGVSNSGDRYDWFPMERKNVLGLSETDDLC